MRAAPWPRQCAEAQLTGVACGGQVSVNHIPGSKRKYKVRPPVSCLLPPEHRTTAILVPVVAAA